VEEPSEGRPVSAESRPGLAPASRRVPGAVFDAAARARAIVAEAEEEAGRIRGEAEAEASRARARALAEGREAGLARAAAEIVRAAEARDRLVAAAVGDVLDAAAALAARILGREAECDGELVVAMAERALAEARGRRRVTLRVNPADEARLREVGTGLAAAVRADPSVSRGGVVVETASGELDGRIEAQVEALRRALDEPGAPGLEGRATAEEVVAAKAPAATPPVDAPAARDPAAQGRALPAGKVIDP
jgi:flagellar biosynthesis/type III secretory pathway protein FliH